MQSYDYVIVGGGLAGLQLALAFAEDSYFNDYIIAIIEPTAKNSNDKTWCYWEKGDGKWDFLNHHQWDEAEVISKKSSIKLNIGSYRYKMVRSIDFYAHAQKVLGAASNIHRINDEIQDITEGHCKGSNTIYVADFIFDSRISPEFQKDTKHIHVHQHFKGWFIQSKQDFFDPRKFSMMDFRLAHESDCFFTYVLPTSKQNALVEATFFTTQLLGNESYDVLLKQYIEDILGISDYEIQEVEQGVIPMSTFPFHQDNTERNIKIGTGGGWVKASSGYSFKSTEKKVRQVVENIKRGKSLDYLLFKKRFRFYDRLFLRILQEENELGNKLFQQMYQSNKGSSIFRFLDEETSLLEEIKITNSFSKAPFLRSLQKEIS